MGGLASGWSLPEIPYLKNFVFARMGAKSSTSGPNYIDPIKLTGLCQIEVETDIPCPH